jgi:hypothetical protein
MAPSTLSSLMIESMNSNGVMPSAIAAMEIACDFFVFEPRGRPAPGRFPPEGIFEILNCFET